MSLLEVTDLRTEFHTDEGVVEAVNGVSLSIEKGETLGVVGESGSGKSVTALSVMGLVDRPGRVVGGDVQFKGTDLRTADDERLRELRGDELSMIFQDPMETLNPLLRVGDQIAEPLRVHGKVDGEDIGWLERSTVGNFVPRRSGWKRYPEAWEQAVEMMREVGIPEAEQRARDYPHQFSGGMQQRAMIAMALACEPDLLIADEPTTALDVTIQAQILERLQDLKDAHGMGMLLITHDLGVVREVCDRVAVMYAGELVETGTVREVFEDPKHPYTKALFESIPRGHGDRQELRPIEGEVPDLVDMPDACFFAPRCPYAHDECLDGHPRMYETNGDHDARCVLYDADDPYGPELLEREGLDAGGASDADGDESDVSVGGNV